MSANLGEQQVVLNKMMTTGLVSKPKKGHFIFKLIVSNLILIDIHLSS